MSPRKHYTRKAVRQMPRIYGAASVNSRQPAITAQQFKWLFFVVMFAAGFYYLFGGPTFKVKHVEVLGPVFADAEQVAASVPKGESIFTLSRREITREILNQPVVGGVLVTKHLPDRIVVSITESEPALRWRSGIVEHVLDRDGFSIASYSVDNYPSEKVASRVSSLPVVRDNAALPVAPYARVASAGFIAFAKEAVRYSADELQRPVVELQVQETTYDLAAVYADNVKVTFNTLGDVGVQMRNLNRIFNQERIDSNTLVDLRIDRWGYLSPTQ